jgi:V-type H+-transporting ATPase subunit C
LTRKQTGNLASRSLVSVVDPKLLIQSSEYIETHLVAIPNSFVKDFLRSYETLSPMVVPRSANVVASDDEYTLYTVTTFKKHSPEFQHKAREKKWVPRDFKFKEGGKEEETREVDRVGEEEKKVWGETLRLGRTGWSEGVMVLIHVIVLRVFVETVLRYGLPLDFVSALVKVRLDFLASDGLSHLRKPGGGSTTWYWRILQTTSKQSKKARTGLDANFAYLAGNAFGKDKKGRPLKDDSSISADMQAAGQAGESAEYSAYVCYGLELE